MVRICLEILYRTTIPNPVMVCLASVAYNPTWQQMYSGVSSQVAISSAGGHML